MLTCDNNGCMKQSEAKLDTETLEVICQECHKPIKNVTEIMKRVLKGSGQVVRGDTKKTFMMACMQCHANRQVVLDENNNTVCKICGFEIKVYPTMKQDMIEAGVKVDAQDAKKKQKAKSTK